MRPATPANDVDAIPFASSPRMELGGAPRGASTIGADPSRTACDARRRGTGRHRLPGGSRDNGAMAWEVRFFADRQAFGNGPHGGLCLFDAEADALTHARILLHRAPEGCVEVFHREAQARRLPPR